MTIMFEETVKYTSDNDVTSTMMEIDRKFLFFQIYLFMTMMMTI